MGEHAKRSKRLDLKMSKEKELSTSLLSSSRLISNISLRQKKIARDFSRIQLLLSSMKLQGKNFSNGQILEEATYLKAMLEGAMIKLSFAESQTTLMNRILEASSIPETPIKRKSSTSSSTPTISKTKKKKGKPTRTSLK